MGSVTCLSGVIQFSKVIRFLGVICLPVLTGLLGMIQLPGVLRLSGHRLPRVLCPPRVIRSPGATVHLRKRFRLLGHSTAAVSWVSPPPRARQPSFPYLCGGQDICAWRTGGQGGGVEHEERHRAHAGMEAVLRECLRHWGPPAQPLPSQPEQTWRVSLRE